MFWRKPKYEPKYLDKIVVPNEFYRGRKVTLLEREHNSDVGCKYLAKLEDGNEIWLTDWEVGAD